jgi:hypothetical protein
MLKRIWERLPSDWSVRAGQTSFGSSPTPLRLRPYVMMVATVVIGLRERQRV